MAWNLPPGCSDADIDRAFGGLDQEGELRAWYNKHMKALDDECTRRQAELDAWYDREMKALDEEFKAELNKLEPDDDQADWEWEKDR